MHGTLIYASIHKHSEAEQDRNQAVCALQTEPIVCRWAFNGPTAGHKERTAPARCYASHSVTLKRGGSSEAHQHHCVYAFDMLFNYALTCMYFPSCQIRIALKPIKRSYRQTI